MSLVQHVSASEGPDRDPDTFSIAPSVTSSVYSLGQHLSYCPVPSLNPTFPSDIPEPIGAYEVSPAKRTVQVFVGVVACMLASGIVFGFAALKNVLIDEGVYRDECTAEELEQNVRLCFGQDLRLNLSFIIGSITTNVAALPVGAILDKYGPRISSIIGCLFLVAGSLCIAYAPLFQPLDAYVTSSFCLALGGTAIFVPTFHLSNAFPRFQGLILALVTGAFDASAAIFLIFRITYESTGGTFSLRHFFLLYTIVPVIILLAQLTIMPSKIYQTIAELNHAAEDANDTLTDIHSSDDELDDTQIRRIRSLRSEARHRVVSEITSLLGTNTEEKQRAQKEAKTRVTSGVWGVLHGQSAWTQIRTPWFVLITLLTIITMARFNFFIATIWTQYVYYFNNRAMATRINDFFDLALPIGGIASVPFIGLLLDNTSTSTVISVLVLISTTFGVLNVLPYLNAAYGNIVLFVLFRPLYYSAMSDYAAKVFGFATFGSVYGAIICLSGLCTFIQFPLQSLTHGTFHDSPTPVNLALTGLGCAVGAGLVGYVVVSGRRMRRKWEEGEDGRAFLPGLWNIEE